MARSLSSTLGMLASSIVLILIPSVSFIISLFLSLLTHVTQTRPYHSFRTSFYATTAATLETNISLQEAPLRSASFMEAYLHITLPESETNLDHPVFTISTTLHTSDHVCVAHTRTNAALRFRSSTMRSLRAIVFWIPLILGLMNEYQSVNVAILQHAPSNHSEWLHRMNIVVSAPLHVSSATVNILVKRRSFISVLGKYIPLILMGTVGLSVVLLACTCCCLAVTWLIYAIIWRMLAMFGPNFEQRSLDDVGQVDNITSSEVSMSSIRSQTSVTTDTTREKYNTLRMRTTALSLQQRQPTSVQAQSDIQ